MATFNANSFPKKFAKTNTYTILITKGCVKHFCESDEVTPDFEETLAALNAKFGESWENSPIIAEITSIFEESIHSSSDPILRDYELDLGNGIWLSDDCFIIME